MAFVNNFVAGAFASRKIASQWLKEIQPRYEVVLKVHRVKVDDSFIYYVVY